MNPCYVFLSWYMLYPYFKAVLVFSLVDLSPEASVRPGTRIVSYRLVLAFFTILGDYVNPEILQTFTIFYNICTTCHVAGQFCDRGITML